MNVDSCFQESRISRQDIQNPDVIPFLRPDGSDFLIKCKEGIEDLRLKIGKSAFTPLYIPRIFAHQNSDATH
jgi:hypothetical protein